MHLNLLSKSSWREVSEEECDAGVSTIPSREAGQDRRGWHMCRGACFDRGRLPTACGCTQKACGNSYQWMLDRDARLTGLTLWGSAPSDRLLLSILNLSHVHLS